MSRQEKAWWIKVGDKKSGPFSLDDLKKHPKFTPDTLVWKEGFANWIAARYVEELEEVFEDEGEKPSSLLPKPSSDVEVGEGGGPAAISGRQDPPPFFIWVLVIFLLLFLILLNLNT